MLADVVAELAPTCVLRAGINLSNFLLVTGKSPNGDPEGVAPDMAREVAPGGVAVEAPDEALVEADERLVRLAVRNLLDTVWAQAIPGPGGRGLDVSLTLGHFVGWHEPSGALLSSR